MIPPTSIDGTDITGATIDGTDVQEITVDGDVVFTAGPQQGTFDVRDLTLVNQIYPGTGSKQDIDLKPDGTRLYITVDKFTGGGRSFKEYEMTTAFDISTLNFLQQFDYPSSLGDVRSGTWNDDGTEWIGNATENGGVFGFTASNPYDISSLSTQYRFDASDLRNLNFNPDGTKMYVVNSTNETVDQYNCSTPFDARTRNFDTSFSYIEFPRGLEVSNDGSKFYAVEETNDEVHQYALSTQFDIGTASLEASFSVPLSRPQAFVFDTFGNNAYVPDYSGDIYQFTTV